LALRLPCFFYLWPPSAPGPRRAFSRERARFQIRPRRTSCRWMGPPCSSRFPCSSPPRRNPRVPDGLVRRSRVLHSMWFRSAFLPAVQIPCASLRGARREAACAAASPWGPTPRPGQPEDRSGNRACPGRSGDGQRRLHPPSTIDEPGATSTVRTGGGVTRFNSSPTLAAGRHRKNDDGAKLRADGPRALPGGRDE